MRLCEICRTPLTKRQKRFCSYKCYGESKRNPRKYCERCGRPLAEGQKRFCSRTCYNPPEPQRYCEICGKILLKRQKQFCSKKCYGEWLHEHPEKRNHFKPGATAWNKGVKGYKAGSEHWNWKGGRRNHSNGYIEVSCPDHPNSNSGGYIFQHRLVMEQHLGRLLTEDEVIHHINSNKRDNRIENLIVLTCSEHQAIHAKEWWEYIKKLIAADQSNSP